MEPYVAVKGLCALVCFVLLILNWGSVRACRPCFSETCQCAPPSFPAFATCPGAFGNLEGKPLGGGRSYKVPVQPKHPSASGDQQSSFANTTNHAGWRLNSTTEACHVIPEVCPHQPRGIHVSIEEAHPGVRDLSQTEETLRSYNQLQRGPSQAGGEPVGGIRWLVIMPFRCCQNRTRPPECRASESSRFPSSRRGAQYSSCQRLA